MSDNVLTMPGVTLADQPVERAMADVLRELAGAVESGEIECDRAVMIFDHTIHGKAFIQIANASIIDALGLLTLAVKSVG